MVSAADSKERIVRAARKLFADRGFDATSTRAIAVEADVPSGLVFYHFPTKEALLEEIVERHDVYHVIDDALAASSSVPANVALETLGIRLFRWLKEHEEGGRIFLKEMGSHREISARMREIRRRSIRLIAAYLDRRVDRESIPRANTELIAEIFVSSILLATIFDRERGARSFARALTTIVFGERTQ